MSNKSIEHKEGHVTLDLPSGMEIKDIEKLIKWRKEFGCFYPIK